MRTNILSLLVLCTLLLTITLTSFTLTSASILASPPEGDGSSPTPPAGPPAASTPAAERRSQDVEDCVACRYIWLQVEMDVGNSQIEENIYDSFTQNCIEAQKAPIFYPACQDMFDGVDDMIGDYMDGYTVNQICENARLCR